jgi:D-sedoheptulose 7-phosphate isomerase
VGWIDQQLDECASLVTWLQDLERHGGDLSRLVEQLASSLSAGHRVLTCGNGGSMCDAMHFAEELSGRYRQDRPALAAQSMSDPAHLSCVANDWGFDRVFARGVEAWGCPGDVLVVFSTSGQSANVLEAAKAARAREMIVIGLLGRDGGAMREL